MPILQEGSLKYPDNSFEFEQINGIGLLLVT